jgi:hypothetical protein
VFAATPTLLVPRLSPRLVFNETYRVLSVRLTQRLRADTKSRTVWTSGTLDYGAR